MDGRGGIAFMRSGTLKGLLKAAGLTAAAALGVFLFAGTSNAQYYPGYGNQYPNYGGYGNQYPGYGNNGRYDNNERKRIEKAYEKGYKDGAKQARRDVRSGGGSANYSLGTRGRGILGGIFNGRNGQSQAQRAYDDGYQRGYNDFYNRNRYNNRGRNGNGPWPF